MKKTYISPSVAEYKLRMNNLLAGSIDSIDTVNTTSEGTIENPVNFSREFDLEEGNEFEEFEEYDY